MEMRLFFRKTWSLALGLALAGLLLCAGVGTAGVPGPPAVFPGALRGQEAIDALADRLPEVARRYGKSPRMLRRLLRENNDLWLGAGENLVYFCAFGVPAGGLTTGAEGASAAGAAPFPLAETFLLHSLPGASRVIYLDFDGHTTSGTLWNGEENNGQDIVSAPFDFDGNPASFSAAEQERIQKIWARVAEDFAIYAIDVTTEAPPPDALRRASAGDQEYGVRVVVSPSSGWLGPYGGVAYIGSFGWGSDTPAFVFSNNLGPNVEKYVAEATSHEVGHTLGLYHDGKVGGTEYYQGHGNWAPIMGVGYYRPIVQWSRGEYPGANNTEDDLAVMLGYGAQYRSDDHGDSPATATSLADRQDGATGIVERRTDADWFSLWSGAGDLSVAVQPAQPDANLDVLLEVFDQSGTRLAAADPPSPELAAALTTAVAGGQYFVRLSGVGTGDPATGYSGYGSLGQYTLTYSSASSRFAVIGDYGDGSSAEGDVAGLVDSWATDFIVTTGDNRYGATSFDTVVGQFYCAYLKDAGPGTFCGGGTSNENDFFPALGNHDYTDSGGLAQYLDYFTLPGAGEVSSNTSGSERYYDFIRGPVQFFVLDSHGAVTDGADLIAQQAWLQAGLAASSVPWQVVVMHHAPYSSSSVHGSVTAMQWPFAAWGADAVLAGHDHTYERLQVDGIPYFVNGLGGRSIYGFGTPLAESAARYNGDYGAMLVEAGEAALSFRFVNRSGAEIDTHTVLPPTVPSAPAGLVASAGGPDRIDLAWTDTSDNETGFRLERSPDGVNGWQAVADLAVDTVFYADTPLAPATTYFYRIFALNAVGNSPASNTASASTDQVVPLAPEGLAATAAGSDRIVLSWTDTADNENGFLVRRSADGLGNWLQIASLPANSSTYTDTGLTPGSTWHYLVVAYNTAGESVSNQASASTDPPPPMVDQIASGELAVSGSVSGSYPDTAVNDGTVESIQEETSGGSPRRRTSFLEHKWLFTVQPGQTVTLFANVWAPASSDGDRFVFAYSTDDLVYSDLFTVTATEDDGSYQSGVLAPSTAGQVFVRVRDTNQDPGNGDKDRLFVDHLFIRSNTEPPTLPAAPSGLLAETLSGSSIGLVWTDNADNELGFTVERSPDGLSWHAAATLPQDSTTWTDSGLLPETTFFYRVRAFNSAGESAASNVASATTWPAPAATVHVGAVEPSSSGNRKSWTARVTVAVHDQDHLAAAGATVSGAWSNGETATAVTASNGECAFSENRIPVATPSIDFSVTGVSLSGSTYLPEANEADGVTVYAP